jgi:hypothetical protein
VKATDKDIKEALALIKPEQPPAAKQEDKLPPAKKNPHALMTYEEWQATRHLRALGF